MFNNDHLTDIYLSLRSRLIRVVAKIAPSKEIEDIVQETYVRVCQMDNPERIQHPRSFLLKTAQNLAFDYLKRAETQLTSSLDDEFEESFSGKKPGTDETFDRVAANQEFAHFCEAVRLLPIQCRRAFILKKVYGYSQKAIAAELGISESTVEKHIAQGIKRCMYFMENREKAPLPGSGKASVKFKSVIDHE